MLVLWWVALGWCGGGRIELGLGHHEALVILTVYRLGRSLYETLRVVLFPSYSISENTESLLCVWRPPKSLR